MAEEKRKFPTEVVDLPSKGLLYPKDHPLSSGQIEINIDLKNTYPKRYCVG